MDQYDYIRLAHRIYQKKIREIARETGHSRNTVKKALQGEYEGYRPRQHQPIRFWDPTGRLLINGLAKTRIGPGSNDIPQSGSITG